jgi:outer membrane protein OmpA-like peptidoglycan-associated protein
MRIIGLSILMLTTGMLFSLGCASSDSPPPAPKPATPAAPPPKPTDPRDFKADVRFEPGDSTLSEAGKTDLNRFAGQLSKFPDRGVQVTGRGPAETKGAERWLPERRAKSVASYLVSQGIGIDRITVRQIEDTPGSGVDAMEESSNDVEVRVR